MDKINVFNGVLSDGLIQRIRAHSHTNKKHRINLTSWTPDVIGWSGAIMLFDLTDELNDEVISELTPFLSIDCECTYEIVYTLGSRLSFIPWHDDRNYVRACTVYLNDFWDKDWAGMFVYDAGDGEFKAVYPEFNKAVVLHPPVMHTTTMPSLNAPLRKSLQVFARRK